MKVSQACPLCRGVVVQIEPEFGLVPVPVPVPVHITSGCSRLCWYMVGVSMVLFGMVGTIMFYMITRESYPTHPRPVNGTG
jgi:hypothetical protein